MGPPGFPGTIVEVPITRNTSTMKGEKGARGYVGYSGEPGPQGVPGIARI